MNQGEPKRIIKFKIYWNVIEYMLDRSRSEHDSELLCLNEKRNVRIENEVIGYMLDRSRTEHVSELLCLNEKRNVQIY